MEKIYRGVIEDILTNMPEPRGNAVMLSMFTNAAFTGDLVIGRSQSGILIFLNGALINYLVSLHDQALTYLKSKNNNARFTQ